jgi:hypothetical protein
MTIPLTASANAFDYKDDTKPVVKQNNSQQTTPKNRQQSLTPVYYNSK